MMRSSFNVSQVAAALLLAIFVMPALAAETASPHDAAFVAKVSQGGLFEVALGRIAAARGSTQAIKNNGMTEMQDHARVGAKLKSIATSIGLEVPDTLNAGFQAKLDRIDALSGRGFDTAYIEEMEKVHKIDGGLFAQEAIEGGARAMKAFAAETHAIVERHGGALRALEKE